MIVTNDKDIASRIKILRDHGMSRSRRYWHPVIGYNYRLTNMQAALGVAQMERIEHIIESKLEIAEYYSSKLKICKGVTLPPHASWAKNVYWLYSILIDEDFRTWILEVNTNPFLGIPNDFIKNLMPIMVSDML